MDENKLTKEDYKKKAQEAETSEKEVKEEVKEEVKKEKVKVEEKPKVDESKKVIRPVVEEVKEEEFETPESEEEEEVEEKEEKKKVKTDKDDEYKKKFSASTRENQKIHAKNRVINRALVEADEIPEPTDEEMTEVYKDWEMMSDIERELAKEVVMSKRWKVKIKEATDQADKIEKWNEAVEKFVDDPKTLVDNPDLEGKTEDFKEYATLKSNNSVPFPLLVNSFLYQYSKGKKTSKGKMFETGSGGPNESPSPKSKKMTLEESRILRDTDYDKWKEKVTKGEIEYDL
jgi:hypothetical protein